jgi:16S rRNA (uracil1498-N3)-methyltransferase
MQLFYSPDIIKDAAAHTVMLNAEESYHCIRVLRKKSGDIIHVTDGRGGLFEAEVTNEDSGKCLVTMKAEVSVAEKKPFNLHLAVAPTKNTDRFEWFLEKATEIGITEITPVICKHSERTVLRTDRLQKILISAMKQSLNLHLPILNEPVKLPDFLKQDFIGQKFIGYVEEQQEKHLKDCYSKGSDCVILIGPEGDFSKPEINLSKEKGFEAISLGNSRLRTETAALVATMIINLLNDR